MNWKLTGNFRHLKFSLVLSRFWADIERISRLKGECNFVSLTVTNTGTQTQRERTGKNFCRENFYTLLTERIASLPLALTKRSEILVTVTMATTYQTYFRLLLRNKDGWLSCIEQTGEFTQSLRSSLKHSEAPGFIRECCSIVREFYN